jgi:hypothetical protein
MTLNVVRFFDRARDALLVASDLEAAGVPRADISIMANNSEDWYRDGELDETRLESHRHVQETKHVVHDDRGNATGTGATLGGLIGGGAGVMAGLGMLAIPGIGPLVAVGWLATAAAGLAAGAVAGGVLGGLVDVLTGQGVTKEDATVYVEGVRRGGALVTARIPAAMAQQVEAIMERRNAIEAHTLRDYYGRNNWEGFDETAAPLTEADIKAEREALRRYPSTPRT